MKKSNILIIVSFVLLIVLSILGGILISFFDFSKNIKNKDASLLLTCETDTIRLGEDVVCTLKGKSMVYEVSSVASKLEKSNNFTFSSINIDSSWEGDGEDGFIALYTDVNKSNVFDIATFSVSLLNDNASEVSINLTDNIFSDEFYEEYSLKDVSVILKVEG